MKTRELVAKLVAIVAAFIERHWKKVSAMGVYQLASWLFDNPLWMSAQAIFEGWGAAAMILIAIAINVLLLWKYSRKKVSWLCWDKGIEFLKEKEGHFKKNFIRVAWAVALLISATLYVENVIYCLGIFFIASFVAMIVLRIFIFLLRCLKIKFWGNVIVFFALSIFQDPFITTATLRRNYSNGLDKRTKKIFFASVGVSIGYWAIRNGIIVETARFLLKF